MNLQEAEASLICAAASFLVLGKISLFCSIHVKEEYLNFHLKLLFIYFFACLVIIIFNIDFFYCYYYYSCQHKQSTVSTSFYIIQTKEGWIHSCSYLKGYTYYL